jgi:hypothetical protein
MDSKGAVIWVNFPTVRTMRWDEHAKVTQLTFDGEPTVPVGETPDELLELTLPPKR